MFKGMTPKDIFYDLLADVVGGMLVAIGVYNFAMNADFPVAGFSGIAIILYHLIKLPVGIGTILLNIPVSLFCYKFLGKRFFLRSMKSMVISSALIDYVAPLLPVYNGDRFLAALSMGVLCGAGYAIIYMRDTSTGGQDFIMMSIRKLKPHLSVGTITMILDISTILLGTLIVFHEVDGFLYGIVVTYITGKVMDRIMYGVYEGKLTFIVTDHGNKVAEEIGTHVQRGTTVIKGYGGYTHAEKDILMCACSNKEMFRLKRKVKELDPNAFTVMMDSSEVMGEGFRENAE